MDDYHKLPAKKNYVFPTSDYNVRHAWDRLVKCSGIEDRRIDDLRDFTSVDFFLMGLGVPEVAFISGIRITE